MPLKAYRLNDYEAWAGKDLDAAIGVCMRTCGVDREAAFEDCFGYEIAGDMEIAGDHPGTVVKVSDILASMKKKAGRRLLLRRSIMTGLYAEHPEKTVYNIFELQ